MLKAPDYPKSFISDFDPERFLKWFFINQLVCFTGCLDPILLVPLCGLYRTNKWYASATSTTSSTASLSRNGNSGIPTLNSFPADFSLEARPLSLFSARIAVPTTLSLPPSSRTIKARSTP
jgi:hypothetical protein